jgi:hypothetical protein
MLTKLQYTVSRELLQQAASCVSTDDFKTTINEPSGRFFYDPWTIRPEYKNTVWEEILNTLPGEIGEARIINLEPAACYQTHSDIDDRYHLNINGEECYLIDFDSNNLHKLSADGFWYSMNAGRLHSAGNFGRWYRVQLVVRQLLKEITLSDPVAVKLTSSGLSKDDTRFLFDQTVSGWLNRANKEQVISDFKFNHGSVEFNIERACIDTLQNILIKEFNLEIL